MGDQNAAKLDRLVERAGTTLSSQAGLRLRWQPAPVFQLYVLCLLLAKPISADMAVDAARELRRIGVTTPRRALTTTWQQRVDAVGRAHYRRYDESTATRIEEGAQAVLENYRGDLRRLIDSADQNVTRAETLLAELPGIGPTGAAIFLREAQAVVDWLVPYFDDRVLDGARLLGLPHSAAGLRRAVGRRDPARVAAALVRVTLDEELRKTVTAEVR